MPRESRELLSFHGYDDFPANPDDWTAEAIMICTTEAFLSVEERVRRALAMYRIHLLSVEGIPVYNVIVARFSAHDNVGFYLQSLARVLGAALAHHKVSFDRDSVSVGGTGRRGQLAFVLTEPFDGQWARH